MPKLDKASVKRGQFMISDSPGCRGEFVGSQDTSYEQEFVERPAPRRPMLKGLGDDRLAEIERQHGAAIATIKQRLDAVRAKLDAVKARRK